MISAMQPALPAPTRPKREWLTVREVAAELGLPIKTVYRWRQANYGPPAHKFGKHWRFRKDLFDAWVDGQLAEDGVVDLTEGPEAS